MPPQAGVTVGHDLTLIRDSYDVEGAGMVDLGQLARTHLGIATGSRSLGSLSTILLRRRLSKDNSVRMGNWEKELTPEQVCTAAVPPQGNSVHFSFVAVWVVADGRYDVCCVCTWYIITRTLVSTKVLPYASFGVTCKSNALHVPRLHVFFFSVRYTRRAISWVSARVFSIVYRFIMQRWMPVLRFRSMRTSWNERIRSSPVLARVCKI